jgi:hypothetical protein
MSVELLIDVIGSCGMRKGRKCKKKHMKQNAFGFTLQGVEPKVPKLLNCLTTCSR